MRALRIAFTVSETAAGSILADLGDRVQHLDFHVIEEVPHNRNSPRQEKAGKGKKVRKAKKMNGIGVAGTLLKALKSERTIDDLKAILEKNGYSAGSLNNALHKLKVAKEIKRVGPATYLKAGA